MEINVLKKQLRDLKKEYLINKNNINFEYTIPQRKYSIGDKVYDGINEITISSFGMFIENLIPEPSYKGKTSNGFVYSIKQSDIILDTNNNE